MKYFQKKGYGELLVLHCKKYISKQNGDLIWFHLPESVVGFYEKLNYIKIENPFIIANIGLHYTMIKKIGECAYE